MKKLSRQRRWQLKQRQLGNCVCCGKQSERRCQYCIACQIRSKGKSPKGFKARRYNDWACVNWELTNPEIAEILGVTPNAVSYQRKKHNEQNNRSHV